jgi:hypothetical protein
MSFGRHQSFYLKENWLSKVIVKFKNNETSILLDESGYKHLGLGKNMHQSLRYWAEATNIISKDSFDKNHSFTEIGKIIAEFDPSVNSKFSKILIHFNLVNNLKDDLPFSDSFFFLFKKYDKNYFTKESLVEDLRKFSKDTISENTLKKDVDCLTQTYIKRVRKHPEDKNISLLSNLELLNYSENSIVKVPLKVDKNFREFFMFGIYESFSEKYIAVDNIHKNISKLFNLTVLETISLIDDMNNRGYPIKIVRTNNINTVNIDLDRRFEYDLKKIYQDRVDVYEA